MLEQAYTDWTLVSLSPLPSIYKIVLALGIVLAAGMVLWSYRTAKRRLRLMVLRGLGALLVLGFLLEPALQLRVVRKIKNRLAVVVDDSRSMSLATEAGQTRHDSVQANLQANEKKLQDLADSHIIEWFSLEGPSTPKALQSPPKAEHSDLLGAIELARESGGGRPLAGIVLISDGADNADLEGLERGTLSAEAKQRLKRIGAPVNTIDAASNGGFKDITVAQVLHDEFAFVHNTAEIDVILEATGFPNTTVPVTLKREGEVIASQEVALEDGQPGRVSFRTKPDQIGEFVYSVEVPAFAGEAVTSNNHRSFVLQVIRDKIRVLQVVGRPAWDERFLRQHLKENPNVDLISFFILRTATDVALAPDDELSLIPFPVDKLFTTELSSFDVIIFQNFDYRPYNMAHYLRNIRDAVRGGLGFVMIGGDQSFAEGGYVGTAIEEIVPFNMHQGGVYYGPVELSLTEGGRRHPITDLARGGAANTRIWDNMPTWTSFNTTAGASPNATVLVESRRHQTSNGQPAPLVAVMEVDKGRSMAVASDAMWRWRFSLHRDGGAAERAYHRFWSNALRWLVRDPEHSRVRVRPEQRRFELGEEVDVSFTVLGEDYQPMPYAQLRVTLEHGGHGSMRMDDVSTGEGGLGRLRYKDLPGGAYRVMAEARTAGKVVGQGAAVFVMEARSEELARGAPRPDLLQAVAKATGGQHAKLSGAAWSNLKLLDPDVVEVDRRRNIELWDNAWALVFGVFLLGLEWALRRRSGYL